MIGETLGQRYRIVRLLGEGGMGAVYAADRSDTGDRVAIKVLHRHILEQRSDAPRRFRREADAAGAIGGDHVARVLDAGTDEITGQHYLVTEYLEGEDLQRCVDRVGPLAPEAVIRIAHQVLVGLVDAHAAGVIHRDVKPANLFLARRGDGSVSVKLLDFGIAKIRRDPLAMMQSVGLTTTQGFLGSPLYMSPEQVQSSRDVDHRADLWSLGSVLYTALTGHAPHEHLASLGQLLVAICVTPARPLAEAAPWVPAEIAEIVRRALMIQPGERFPTAAAMLDAVRRVAPSGALDEAMITSSGEQARPVVASSQPPSPSSPRVIIAPSDPPIRGDERTEVGRITDLTMPRSRVADPSGATLPSAPAENDQGLVARSGVPMVGARAAGRHVTVDPRRLLGQSSELWTFSLDVHRHVSSLVGRVWKSLRRAGAKVPPMSYGTAWVLFEPRTGRAIGEVGERLEQLSLEAAGIRPGTILWVVEPGPEDPRNRG